jgi:hypothetical protein
MTEGHARTLLMLTDRPEQQTVLFKEILLKKLTVRAAEKIARRVAYDKIRKKERAIDPHTIEAEEEMRETLGTRVHIERKAVGGKIEIDFFSEEDLNHILKMFKEKDFSEGATKVGDKLDNFVEQSGGLAAATSLVFEKEQSEHPEPTTVTEEIEKIKPFEYSPQSDVTEEVPPVENTEEVKEEEKEVVQDNSQYSYDANKEEDVEVPATEKTENIPVAEETEEEKEVVQDNSQYSYNATEEKTEEVPTVENTEEATPVHPEPTTVTEEIEKIKPFEYSPQSDVTEEPKEVTPVENTEEIKEEETKDNESVSIPNDPVPQKPVENEGNDVKSEVEAPQPRSKYLEKIDSSDMGNINIGSDFMGSNTKEDGDDKNHIVKERNNSNLNKPNVITDFVEIQKESNSNNDVDTPSYGNDDDLYSVKGM